MVNGFGKRYSVVIIRSCALTLNIVAHSASEMFSLYRYLIVSLIFSRLGFWSGNLFLIAPFPDRCLLVPFCYIRTLLMKHGTISCCRCFRSTNLHQ